MRYALGVEYDGSNFKGWQRLTPYGQEGGPRTLQVTLEDALSGVASHPVEVICAGRTDAGVHAECQVVNFDSDAQRDPRAWVLGTTTRLPPAMRVRWCVPVSDGFNARFSARARRYRYRLLNHQVRELGYNIPPLVNAYMNLSPTMRFFGTAVNHEFGEVEESGILIAVDEIFEEKRVRHINSFVAEHPEALKIPMPKK